MTVPDFQSMMLPFLKIAGDEQEHSFSETVEVLARQLSLSSEDLKETLPSGQSRFENRAGWARTHLKKAGLLEPTGRGRFRISARGKQILKNPPVRIDLKFLMQFPEFVEFRKASRQGTKSETDNEVNDEPDQTPEEALENSYQRLRITLAQELLERIKGCSPSFFERLVVDLLVAMGYGGSRKDAGQAIGQSGDEGIDGIIKEDKLGLDAVYIQAKKWSPDRTVGRPVVQAFMGSLAGQKAHKGVLITTSQFSQEAREYINRIDTKIVLIDGEQLAQLMIDHGVGVSEVATYTVNRADVDYFENE
ncbi:MAG TPA: restriction endonuclease [Anaerolineae bacterium]|nr:restriction endonuclease [Anaerolineae bacterium]